MVTHGALSAAGLVVNHGVVVSSVRCIGGWDALELNFDQRHAYHKESAGVELEVMACGASPVKKSQLSSIYGLSDVLRETSVSSGLHLSGVCIRSKDEGMCMLFS